MLRIRSLCREWWNKKSLDVEDEITPSGVEKRLDSVADPIRKV